MTVNDGMTTRTATKPALYLFDDVFAIEPAGAPPAPPAITTAALDKAVAAARKEAHAAGLAEGRRAGEQALAGRLADTIEKLVAATAAIAGRAEADRAEIETTAVELAMAAVGRLAPALVSREPAAELAALLRDCLNGLRKVPHIAIRISEDLVEPMRAEFDKVAVETGFAGRIVVLGDPDIAPGDGRIDWADGGIARDMGETRRSIEAAVENFIASRSGPAGGRVDGPVDAPGAGTAKDETDE